MNFKSLNDLIYSFISYNFDMVGMMKMYLNLIVEFEILK